MASITQLAIRFDVTQTLLLIEGKEAQGFSEVKSVNVRQTYRLPAVSMEPDTSHRAQKAGRGQLFPQSRVGHPCTLLEGMPNVQTNSLSTCRSKGRRAGQVRR